MTENPFKQWHCVRCGHDWWSKLPLPPRYCAKCKKPNWNRPKVERSQSMAPPKRPVGRPPLYPFHNLEVGESCNIDFVWGTHGPDIAKNDAVHRSVRKFEARTGRKFLREPKSSFLAITRIA